MKSETRNPKLENKGLVYVFTGNGKGKTSAALGVAVRATLIGEKVVWISFYKGKDWDLAEKHLPEKIENIEMHWVGKGFRIAKGEKLKAKSKIKIAMVAGGKGVVVDTASEEEHVEAARSGLQLAGKILMRKSSDHSLMQGSELGDKPFLLVLDEVLNAVSEGLLESNEVIELLGKRGETHIVLTGRGANEEIVEAADLVTECKKIKHPYDEGKLAVRGLDF